MLDTIGEFKINAISPEDIRKASEKIESAPLKSKLHDIALIYETYDMLTGEKFIDPTDKLAKLNNRLETTKFFENKTVFFDSFKGFTGQQYKIMERIFAQTKDIYVSLTDNPKVSGEFCIYSNIRKAKEKIIKIANRFSLPLAETIYLTECYSNNKEISNLEKLLSMKILRLKKAKIKLILYIREQYLMKHSLLLVLSEN